MDGLDFEFGQDVGCPSLSGHRDRAMPGSTDNRNRRAPMISASSRQVWRAWLKGHHATEDEVWLVYYKKYTGKPSVTYIESVKEALCFGWIDGIKKSVDDETYMHRFTPRKPDSKWSPRNIRLARELIASGDMADAGLRAFEQRTEYDSKTLQARKSRDLPLEPYSQHLWIESFIIQSLIHVKNSFHRQKSW